MNDNKMFKLIMGYAVVVIVVMVIATIFKGCKTLDVIKSETASIKSELQTAVDDLGAEIIGEIAEKVKREIRRTREKLPMKIRREIERGALKIGLRLNLKKPPSKREKARAAVYVSEIRKTEKYKSIVKGNTPVLPPEKGTSGHFEANYTQPTHYKWEPSEELKSDFFESNPKVRSARKELQYLLMAMWDLNLAFVGYEGHRSCARQREMYEKKVSQIKSCTGDHNTTPANAVEPCPAGRKKSGLEQSSTILLSGRNRQGVVLQSCKTARVVGGFSLGRKFRQGWKGGGKRHVHRYASFFGRRQVCIEMRIVIQ